MPCDLPGSWPADPLTLGRFWTDDLVWFEIRPQALSARSVAAAHWTVKHSSGQTIRQRALGGKTIFSFLYFPTLSTPGLPIRFP